MDDQMEAENGLTNRSLLFPKIFNSYQDGFKIEGLNFQRKTLSLLYEGD